jgi:hypothetical protein
MDIWLLFTIPIAVWIAIIIWLKPRGNKGGIATRNGNDWQAPCWDGTWSGGNASSDVSSGFSAGDCGATGTDASGPCQ